MYPDPSEPVVPGNRQPSPFTCIVCKQGEMLPAVQEGEPDYTDNFICQQCNHRDIIPALPNIYSQIVTAILGGAIGLYLLISNLTELLQAFQNKPEDAEVFRILLIVIAGLFTSGFTYVLYQAHCGFQQRRAYINAGKARSKTVNTHG